MEIKVNKSEILSEVNEITFSMIMMHYMKILIKKFKKISLIIANLTKLKTNPKSLSSVLSSV